MAIPKEYISSPSVARAIEHCKKFLTLWKDANPGIAEFDDARGRLAKLQKSP